MIPHEHLYKKILTTLVIYVLILVLYFSAFTSLNGLYKSLSLFWLMNSNHDELVIYYYFYPLYIIIEKNGGNLSSKLKKEGYGSLFVCRYCPEVYIGENGHEIRTCGGFRRRPKVHVHEWTNGNLNDVLVPVEVFHLKNMFQNVIEHNERFDFDRVPAVVELCWQAGADASDQVLYSNASSLDRFEGAIVEAKSLSGPEMKFIACETLKAWEALRSGVQKLLLVYPTKVCEHCSEVHVGPSGHRAHLCGVFKYESWRGKHFWRKAKVDDLVRLNTVWCQRPQDPPVLKNEGREYYGHAPAVVDLCTKAGAVAPSKYHCMMKMEGLTAPS